MTAGADTRETTLRDWCTAQSIPFVSTTAALREAARTGVQGYFSYDQHWTPLGHEIVARTIHQFVENHLAPENR